MATFLTDDPRPPCIGELRKGCSMGNTEVLVESMAAKIQVLKERLAATEHRGGHSIEACKLDCLMSMLPLVLGSRPTALGPAMMAPGAAPDVSHLHSKIASLEAEKVKLKAEKEALDQECTLLKSRCEQLQITAAAVPPSDDTHLEGTMQAVFGTPVLAPTAEAVVPGTEVEELLKINQKLEEETTAKGAELEKCQQQLREERNLAAQGGGEQLEDCIAKAAECKAELAKIQERLGEKEIPTEGAPEAPAPPQEPVATPSPETSYTENEKVNPDDPRLVRDQGKCEELTETERTLEVGKSVRDQRTRKLRVQYQDSIQEAIRKGSQLAGAPKIRPTMFEGQQSTELEWSPQLMTRVLMKKISELKAAYQRLRPDFESCVVLKNQYTEDVRNMAAGVACAYVSRIISYVAPYKLTAQMVFANIPQEFDVGGLNSQNPEQTSYSIDECEKRVPGFLADATDDNAIMLALQNIMVKWFRGSQNALESKGAPPFAMTAFKAAFCTTVGGEAGTADCEMKEGTLYQWGLALEDPTRYRTLGATKSKTE